ncbi:acyl-CoA esterase [Kordiimonas sediminis]|uniref:Acyl-CoA esterase n=1 Tax=Kordiimonas sediminis TaxID=1735581 RepID=A0A919AUA1_9PROT|nr:alpha/beta fold hydrolase [Kordiimonas sediminis]GHF23365.1 acyl-CoA esterase [Kordiimonas sediminis]
MKLFHRIRGEGHPVVLLHGLFGSADNLGALARALEEDYQVIAVDLRNHGRSDHADDMTYPLLAADVIELLDDLGLDEDVYLVGHSMGGKTSMQTALTIPERIGKLVVLDIAPVQYSHGHDSILAGMQAVSEKGAEGRKPAGEILKQFIDEPEIISFILTNWRKNKDGKWGWRLNLDAILDQHSNIMAGNDGTPYLGPTLFVRGGTSNYITADHKDQILELFPRATVRTVEGTGHWLHAEKPDMVNRIVKRFLSE